MAAAAPRRFKVEAIETSVRSSRDPPLKSAPMSQHDPPPGRTQPSVENARGIHRTPAEKTTKNRRRFAVEPIETSTRSSKDKAPKQELADRCASPSRSGPIVFESSTRRSRKRFDKDWDEQTTSPTEKRERRPPRRFSPQLIGTASRSRRVAHLTPTVCCTGPDECANNQCLESTQSGEKLGETSSSPEPSPGHDFSQNPLFAEIQRATSPATRRRPGLRACQHSFRVPDLDPIESSESEASGPPSPILSRSFSSHPSLHYREPTRARESVDETTSGYLLALAAKAAEQQLREQAMAAFPNNDHHQRVAHFVDREEDAETSASEDEQLPEVDFSIIDWKTRGSDRPKPALCGAAETRQANFTPHGLPADMLPASGADVADLKPRDGALERMRTKARPPMLGKELVFPRCPSPEPARFDTTQGCDVVKKAMCYLTEQSQAAEKGESLWCGNGNGRQVSKVPSLWSSPSSRSQSRSGLWGGFCVDSGLTPPRGPTGLLTPMGEKTDPASPCPTPAANLLYPPTPPASNADFACIDEKLAAELSIEEEFGDDFITQVYNYLSLGYPSMARPFDEELSKISKIPVRELRQDDELAQSRGYIRLGTDGNLRSAEITEESCMRWRALRIYVREWAKQQPSMALGEQAGGGVGTAVRRGSWAW